MCKIMQPIDWGNALEALHIFVETKHLMHIPTKKCARFCTQGGMFSPFESEASSRADAVSSPKNAISLEIRKALGMNPGAFELLGRGIRKMTRGDGPCGALRPECLPGLCPAAAGSTVPGSQSQRLAGSAVGCRSGSLSRSKPLHRLHSTAGRWSPLPSTRTNPNRGRSSYTR